MEKSEQEEKSEVFSTPQQIPSTLNLGTAHPPTLEAQQGQQVAEALFEDEPPEYQLPSTFTGFLWEVFVGGGANSPGSHSTTATQSTVATASSALESPSTSHPQQHTTTTTTTAKIEESTYQQTKNNSTIDNSPSILGYLSSYILSVQPSSPPKELTLPQHAALDTTPATTNYDPLESMLDHIPISLQGKDADVESILTPLIASQLSKSFPARYKNSVAWTLAYSLQQHGISMQTLYGNMANICETAYAGITTACPSVLIIKDADGDIFGGFVTEMWRSNSGSGSAKETASFLQATLSASPSSVLSGSVGRGRSYYGTGESFVFEYISSENLVIPYTWSFKNDYFMLSESDFIAMGGGDGKFTIFIDGDLYKGYTAASPTFTNHKPLTHQSEFACIGLELWVPLP